MRVTSHLSDEHAAQQRQDEDTCLEGKNYCSVSWNSTHGRSWYVRCYITLYHDSWLLIPDSCGTIIVIRNSNNNNSTDWRCNSAHIALTGILISSYIWRVSASRQSADEMKQRVEHCLLTYLSRHILINLIKTTFHNIQSQASYNTFILNLWFGMNRHFTSPISRLDRNANLHISRCASYHYHWLRLFSWLDRRGKMCD